MLIGLVGLLLEVYSDALSIMSRATEVRVDEEEERDAASDGMDIQQYDSTHEVEGMWLPHKPWQLMRKINGHHEGSN